MSSSTEEDKRICAEMKEIRELILEFGLTLSGRDPGITAYLQKNPKARGDGWAGEPIALNDTEWNWLKPLLAELSMRRKESSMTVLEAAKKGAEWMRWWVSNACCECEHGHTCGQTERKKELKEIDQAVKAEEKRLRSKGK